MPELTEIDPTGDDPDAGAAQREVGTSHPSGPHASAVSPTTWIVGVRSAQARVSTCSKTSVGWAPETP